MLGSRWPCCLSTRGRVQDLPRLGDADGGAHGATGRSIGPSREPEGAEMKLDRSRRRGLIPRGHKQGQGGGGGSRAAADRGRQLSPEGLEDRRLLSTGVFPAAGRSYATVVSPEAAAVADFNRDGKLD